MWPAVNLTPMGCVAVSAPSLPILAPILDPDAQTLA